MPDLRTPLDEALYKLTMVHLAKLEDYVPGPVKKAGGGKAALIARQAREKGVQAQLLGPDGWDSPDLVKIAGSAVEGGYFVNHYSPEDTRPEVVAWVKKYKDRHGQLPDALGTLAYDGTQLLFEAIRRAGSDDPKKIRDALASIRDFKAVSGKSTLDGNGDMIKSAAILKIEGGRQKFVKMVTP